MGTAHSTPRNGHSVRRSTLSSNLGILCGITMLHVSYNDRNTYSRFTIPYIDNIERFFVGAVLICYGLIRIFCE